MGLSSFAVDSWELVALWAAVVVPLTLTLWILHGKNAARLAVMEHKLDLVYRWFLKHIGIGALVDK